MYVKVHVLVPLQIGLALGTPADTVNARPQLSVTGGAVGAVVKAGHCHSADDGGERR